MSRTKLQYTWCLLAAGALLLGAPLPALAGTAYELPVCQMIYEDHDRDAALREAQLEYCSIAEESILEFVRSAPDRGFSEDDAHMFALLFLTAAHWERLTAIEGAIHECGEANCADEDGTGVMTAGAPGPGGAGGGQ